MTKIPVPTTAVTIAFFMLIFTTCDQGVGIEKKDIVAAPIQKVLILGNSITITHPVPEIGWYGTWGMAATTEANDYVHLLIDRFKKYNDSIEVRYASISQFEREFWNFDYSQLNNFQSFAPDLIILRIGDNVREEDTRKENFQEHLHKLITYLSNNRRIMICNTSPFWRRPEVSEQIQLLSIREHYIYVPLSYLSSDWSNMAKDEYEDPDVGDHPSDKGMKEIADRIAAALGIL